MELILLESAIADRDYWKLCLCALDAFSLCKVIS